MPTNLRTYQGRCLCGEVRLEVEGDPQVAGFCHCKDCRLWHAAPVNAWATWPSKKVRVIKGHDLVVEYEKGDNIRCRCSKCGSGLMNRKPNRRTVVYAVVLAASGFSHRAEFHIHCDESVLDMQDGLPKYLDVPKEWGGSGRTLPEPEKLAMHSIRA